MAPLCQEPDHELPLISAESHVRLTFPCNRIILGFQGAKLLVGGAGGTAAPCRSPRRRPAPTLHPRSRFKNALAARRAGDLHLCGWPGYNLGFELSIDARPPGLEL